MAGGEGDVLAGGGIATYIVKIKFFVKVLPADASTAAEAAAEAAIAAAAAAAIAAAAAAAAGRRAQQRKRPSRRTGGRAQQRRRPTSGAALAGQATSDGAESDGSAGGGGDSAAGSELGDPPAPLRIAVCDMYLARTSDDWRGEGFYIDDMRRPWRESVPLPLHELGQKVVACFALKTRQSRAANAPDHSAAFFPYRNMSNTVQL